MTLKRKLMLIIPEMTVGGAQRSLANLSIELARYVEVFLVVFNNNDDVAYPVGGKVLCLNVIPGVTIVAKGIALMNRVERLRSLKKKYDIDVAVSFLEGADYINVLSKEKDKVILSIRGSKLHDENMQKYFYWLRNRVLIPWLYKKADLIVAVNEGIALELKHHHRLPSPKIVTIGNFYDRDTIVQMSNEKKEHEIAALYNKKKVLVMSGRLAAEKGIAGVISMFSELLKQRNDICLVIVGDGPEKNALIQLALEKGLQVVGKDLGTVTISPDVLFIGAQNNVFKYLRDASLYLMNSSSEGFPNGLVEAMICGVPVISSDCPYGPAEILAPELKENVTNGNPFVARYGVLMPIISGEEQVTSWVSTISSILDNKELLNNLSTAAYKRTTDFDRETVIKQWLGIISS